MLVMMVTSLGFRAIYYFKAITRIDSIQDAKSVLKKQSISRSKTKATHVISIHEFTNAMRRFNLTEEFGEELTESVFNAIETIIWKL